MANFADQGTVYSASSTAITTGYSGVGLGSAIEIGAASKAAFDATISTAAASTMTAVTLKLQASYDGTNYFDVVSRRLDNNNTELEHVYSALSANTTYYFGFSLDMNIMALAIHGFRVCCKATFSAGSGQAGDAVTVHCGAF